AQKTDDSQLQQAMKKVGRRLQNGTNLRDSDEVFMPLIDAIAVATEEERKTSDFAAAEKAEAMFSIAQQTWQYRINSMIIGSRTGTKQWMVRHCKQMESYVKSFNSVADAKAVTWRWRKNGIFGLCKWDGSNPDSLMVQAVGDFLVKP
ncbi:hypothetical protein N8458_02150, partial [Synechococcus sp. AH-601-P18]|nr:hypothetical protein [Synechococcus sp. AH-601-P18]